MLKFGHFFRLTVGPDCAFSGITSADGGSFEQIPLKK